nr:50S ribosomal protein L11 methyltransferase [Gammaproteobacteria bacterium]
MHTIDHPKILEQQQRFAFGKNWSRFLKYLTEDRILEAEKSLVDNLGLQDLKGKTFLDVGSGSGLFSLAAHRLGATAFSFDYNQDSVNCTQSLKENYGNKDQAWSVQQGSVLD